MRGLCCFLVAFSLTVCAGLAFAADWTVTAEHGNWYSRNVTPASAVRSNTTFAARAMVPSGPVVYTAREVVYSPATVGRLFRFAASPAGVATITAATLLVDWWRAQPGNVIAPSGEMQKSGESGECAAGSVTYKAIALGSTRYQGTSLGAGVSAISAFYSTIGWRISRVQWDSVNKAFAVYADEQNGNVPYHDGWITPIARSGCPVPPPDLVAWYDVDSGLPPEWLPYVGAEDSGMPAPVTDEQLADDILASPFGDNEDVLRDLASDANGRPWNTAEIDAMRRAIRDELASQDGTDPATLPDVPSGSSADPANPDAPETQPDGYSSVPPGGGASGKTEVTKLPDFCGWAGVVCDWLGWTQEPLDSLTDAPDLPITESGPASWDSGLGAGACPAPIEVAALGASVSISWQPACDFVSMLRPILIAFAGIAAALILLGQRAGGAG